ncbi:MAG: type III polyketide synthase [Phycisphaerales bacterium]|nr:type III polyketide synthase [Planctomycetota bacterium]
MSDHLPCILGLGTATPRADTSQEEALALALKLSPAETEDARRQIELIYRRSGVERRATTASLSVQESGECGFSPASLRQPLGPGTAARMAIYRLRAMPLAVESSRLALLDCAMEPSSITHLVTASCTGFAAPGWDVEVVDALGLPRNILRTNVGFMGCHGAINAIRVARAFAAADPAARVLVCCTEICSVHFRYKPRPDQAVANALFADGSAAVVVGQPRGKPGRGGLVLRDTASCILPDSQDQMGWSVGDHGFEMSLGIELPATIRRSAGLWLREWLGANKLEIGSIRRWAVHPGGPKILSAVAEALELRGSELEASKGVLARHGNMSSPTVLFILDELQKRNTPGGPGVLLSFGPGIAAEAILFEAPD